LGTPALYRPEGVVVDVIDEREEMSYVKFPQGKVIWVRSDALDFEDLVDDATAAALDSPTDFDEYEMNPDDSAPEDYGDWDDGDRYDFEYDR
jgi:hypothetical protein